MAKIRKDGGPAFPRSDAGYSPTQEGMSLREWFAGQALCGLIAARGWQDENGAIDGPRCVEIAYAFADEMLRQS